ncbi:MAG TPA: GIY-YIG nuclease family protein [Candidatus Paceibacterota bacterium]|nr:GIY-YIG nuclease family protein [Candidatus Paceibacterota bacterium]
MTLEQFKKRMSTLPDTPGVYFFLDARKKILYIGKATSLRSRVRSYFASDLHRSRGPLIVEMVKKATSVEWRATDSVLEALILEANLIKRHKPKHNTDLKDDKSWNYVIVTKEDFPRVLLVRGKELAFKNSLKGRDERDPNSLLGNFVKASQDKTQINPAHIFGPFPHGAQLKEALKIIRKIFPYRDTCTPCAEQGPSLRQGAKGRSLIRCKPCFNAAIGLCPGVCSGAINKTEYRKIVRRMVMLFQGKKSELIKSLERDMKRLAKAERFEEAAVLRGQLFALKHIQDVSLIKEEFRSPSASLGAIRGMRIEAYDAAHLGGSAMVGVMTVVENGSVLKNEYRKFKIKSANAGDDIGALREMLSRRLAHDEWPLPRMIVVDGSTAQLNAADKALAEYGIRIPVVSVTKDDKHRARAIQGDRGVITGHEHDILLANAEAHRFAIAYHRKLRSTEMGL